jgi:hypothetical protein
MIGKPEKLLQYIWNLDKDKEYEIKEVKKKRSLSQNAYAWKLITEIGNVLRKSKEEIYLQMLIDYGVSEEILMLSSIDPVGYFKYYKAISKIKKDNKEFTIYRIYKGSSEFNSKEMSIFIDGIIQECENLEIETLTPEEIKRWELI